MTTKRFIVTTTINAPTEAIERFDRCDGFELIVIGDKKTPAGYTLSRGQYIGPDEQEAKYPRLSQLLGWNCIQRRNIGFLLALEMGAEVVASVDDDNIPYANWGQDLLIGKSIAMKRYATDDIAFDPVGATNYPHLWHRGFPIQHLRTRDYGRVEEVHETVRIQADFWDGDPDIDAICRMIHRPNCKFDASAFPFTTKSFVPFNSQNTFLDAQLLPNYFMFTGIGRMDDIWGAYYLEAATGARPVFCPASVEQQRNVHDLTRDFSGEVIGYERTYMMLQAIAAHPDNLFSYIPGSSVAAFLEYRRLANDIQARRAAAP